MSTQQALDDRDKLIAALAPLRLMPNLKCARGVWGRLENDLGYQRIQAISSLNGSLIDKPMINLIQSLAEVNDGQPAEVLLGFVSEHADTIQVWARRFL